MNFSKFLNVLGLLATLFGAFMGFTDQLPFFWSAIIVIGGAAVSSLNESLMKGGNSQMPTLIGALGVMFGAIAEAIASVGFESPGAARWILLCKMAFAALTAVGGKLRLGEVPSDSLKFLLVGALLIGQSGCGGIFGGAAATPMKKFVSQLDNNSIAAREYQASLTFFLQSNLLTADQAEKLSEPGERFRVANRTVIDFLFNYVTLDEKGNRIIQLDLTAKGELERLTDNLAKSAQQILGDVALVKLNPQVRAQWQAAIAAISETAKVVTKLVSQIKATPTKISVKVPETLWQEFVTARQQIMTRESEAISYGF